jgi:hypothetical protein
LAATPVCHRAGSPIYSALRRALTRPPTIQDRAAATRL